MTGQSNMAFPLGKVQHSDIEIAQSNLPLLRFFSIDPNEQSAPQDDIPAEKIATQGWAVSSPETSRDFSAIGYIFNARPYMEELKQRPGWQKVPNLFFKNHRFVILIHEPMLKTPQTVFRMIRLKLPVIACALSVLSAGFVARAAEPAAQATALLLGAPFADHAVFQQGFPLPVWGTAGPGAKIEATFAGQTKTANANADGTWRVTLDPLKATKLKSVNDAPEVHTLKITSTLDGNQDVRELRDIAIGDVWLCAGQSNIAGSIRKAVNSKNHPPDSVAVANYPGLRFLKVENQSWDVCTPETVLGCSRVSFFFARRVQQETLVPIGLIVRAVGGSNIESWLNQEPHPVGGNYAKLMTPVVGYGIRGAIWYQGESNGEDGLAYRPKLESLITGWRKAWGQGDIPFHFVQLPGLNESPTDNPAMGDGRAGIRQAFFETLALPNTGMAVAIDVGTKGEHPPNKFDTAERLARSVLQKVYGLENITACPLYKSHKVEGNTVRISFTDDAKYGLMIAKKATTLPDAFEPATPTSDAKLQWLSLQDEGGQWHWADAKIDGAELIVSAESVAKPVAVRYAYTTQPLGHLLYNKDGMPVGPFSTSGHDPP